MYCVFCQKDNWHWRKNTLNNPFSSPPCWDLLQRIPKQRWCYLVKRVLCCPTNPLVKGRGSPQHWSSVSSNCTEEKLSWQEWPHGQV